MVIILCLTHSRVNNERPKNERRRRTFFFEEEVVLVRSPTSGSRPALDFRLAEMKVTSTGRPCVDFTLAEI